MIGRLKSGKIINGRLAETFVSRGIAVEVKEITDTEETKEVEVKEITAVINKPTKRKRRTKAQIEADKK